MFMDRDDPRAGHGRHRGRDFENGPGPHRGGRRGPYAGGRGGPGRFPLGLAGLFGRGPAVRRGDVRSAVLVLLGEGPMHGYQIMQELTERSGGAWRPSAGSVYPTLQQLEDEGLVRGEERDGRRVFTLTERGAGASAMAAKEPAPPWQLDSEKSAAIDLHRLVIQLLQATTQVGRAGTPAAQARARQILTQARRDMYRILADDEADAVEQPAGDPETPLEAPDERV